MERSTLVANSWHSSSETVNQLGQTADQGARQGTSMTHDTRSDEADLVKVGWEPVHDHIEGVVEGEVVDDNRPYCRMSHHAAPRGWGRAPLLASFLS